MDPKKLHAATNAMHIALDAIRSRVVDQVRKGGRDPIDIAHEAVRNVARVHRAFETLRDITLGDGNDA